MPCHSLLVRAEVKLLKSDLSVCYVCQEPSCCCRLSRTCSLTPLHDALALGLDPGSSVACDDSKKDTAELRLGRSLGSCIVARTSACPGGTSTTAIWFEMFAWRICPCESNVLVAVLLLARFSLQSSRPDRWPPLQAPFPCSM